MRSSAHSPQSTVWCSLGSSASLTTRGGWWTPSANSTGCSSRTPRTPADLPWRSPGGCRENLARVSRSDLGPTTYYQRPTTDDRKQRARGVFHMDGRARRVSHPRRTAHPDGDLGRVGTARHPGPRLEGHWATTPAGD